MSMVTFGYAGGHSGHAPVQPRFGMVSGKDEARIRALVQEHFARDPVPPLLPAVMFRVKHSDIPGVNLLKLAQRLATKLVVGLNTDSGSSTAVLFQYSSAEMAGRAFEKFRHGQGFGMHVTYDGGTGILTARSHYGKTNIVEKIKRVSETENLLISYSFLSLPR